MKILFFMDVFIFGGIEKMLKQITDQLLCDGCCIDILLLYQTKANSYLDKLDPKINIKYIYDVDSKPNIVKRLYFWKNVLLPKRVMSKIDTAEYDWVISFKDDYQINILSSTIKEKKIVWVHNIIEDYNEITRNGLKYKIANIFYRYIYHKFIKSFTSFDRVICVSKHAQQALRNHCLQDVRSVVIYNYTDAEAVRKLAKEPISEEFTFPFLCCYVGRLSAEKGVVDIVRSVCEINQEGLKVGLLVIGEGYQLADLQSLVKEMNCEKNVLFLGTKNNPYPYIAMSDVLVCASHKESFGLTVQESISLGTWVISTMCGGPEELITDQKNGTLFPERTELKSCLLKYYFDRTVPSVNVNEKSIGNRTEFYLKLHAILSGE